MALVNGNDIVVKIGAEGSEEKIYCSTSCTLNLNQATVSSSCKDGGNWDQSTDGNKSWTVSVDGLYDPEPEVSTKGFIDLADLIITGPNEVSLIIGQDLEGDTFWTGDAILTSCSLTGPANENATWTAEFTGNGPLESGIVPAP